MIVRRVKRGNKVRLLNRQGITLVELIVAMALAGIITAGLYSVYASTLGTYETQNSIVRSEMNVRAALNLIASELRMAGYSNASFGFILAAPAEVQFSYDMDADNAFSSEEKVYFRFRNQEVQRKTDGEAWAAVAAEIRSLHFTYMDRNGSPTSDPTKIRSVRITIRGANSSRDASTTVHCRNLGG